MSMRRILIIGAVAVVLLGAGGVVYWKYFTGGPGLVASEPTSTTLPSAGATTDVSGTGTAASSDPSALAATKVTSRLTKIAVGPVVPGEVITSVGAGSSTSASTTGSGVPDVAVEFIERESGNIFSYLVGAGRLTRTSNKTVPGIMRARWTPDGKTAFVTYLSGATFTTINTYGLASDGSGGFFLPTGLADIAVSSSSLLMLATGSTGSVASLAKADGTGSATVFTSPLSSLRVSFGPKKGYIVFTKPSQSLGGDVFAVTSAGIFTRLAGPLPGLVALANHSGSSLLVSSANGGVMRVALVDATTGKRVALPIATIADKCAWSADDSAIYCGVPIAPSTDYSYPDDWYQGAMHFTDRIWKIDVHGRFAQLVFDPTTVSSVGALDAGALALDPSSTVLVFVNKNDGSLWSYKL